MKKSLTIFFLSIFAIQFSLAQRSDTNHIYEEFSLRGDLGTSIINVTGEEEKHTEYGVSGNAGLVWTHHYEGVSFFRMEFGVSIFNSTNSVSNVPYVDEDGNVERMGTITTKKKLSYLTFPFFYGIEMKKLSIAAGFQFGMLMGGEESVVSDNGPYDPAYTLCYLGSSTFDYGLRFTASWKLSRKLHIEGSYYHGFNDVVSGSCKDRKEKWNLAQLTFGLRYNFHFHSPDPTTREIRKQLKGKDQTHSINVEYNEAFTEIDLLIRDISGRIIERAQLTGSENKTFYLNSPSGMYIIEMIVDGKKKELFKVIKY